MPRRIGGWLAIGCAAAVLAWACWPGAPGDPATLISRIDVIATVLILAGMPWLVRRRFGPMSQGWLPLAVRLSGYAAVFGLVLVKARVESFEFAGRSGRLALDGLWLGEVVFVLLLAAYIAGLLAVTARRPPASPAALAIGTGAGIVLGLTIYVMRPLAGPLHTGSGWLTGFYVAARLLAVPLVCATLMAAGLAAARRTSRRDSRRPLADSRARQGVAAGLCAGAAAALLVSVLGLSTIALVPHLARLFQWTLPSQQPGSVYAFEASFSDAAAGYLLVLIFFPLCGAGLGAWGGLYGSEHPDHGPGGGGGGGPDDPKPRPTPPTGGRKLDAARLATVDLRRALELPPRDRVAGRPEAQPAPDRRERAPTRVG